MPLINSTPDPHNPNGGKTTKHGATPETTLQMPTTPKNGMTGTEDYPTLAAVHADSDPIVNEARVTNRSGGKKKRKTKSKAPVQNINTLRTEILADKWSSLTEQDILAIGDNQTKVIYEEVIRKCRAKETGVSEILRKIPITLGRLAQYGRTVAKLFPNGKFPVGEIQDHPGDFNTYRKTSAEKRARERAEEDLYEKVRYASKVHRHVRKFAQSMIKPGIRLIDLCEQLENKNRELVEEAGFARGIGFPTGCSLNHVAAHYTPNSGDDTVLSYGDVMKIDFGTQVDGRIIDSAFTVAFDPKFDPLLAAAKAATEEGIKHAGIDARLGEIGAAIQEVMESYEVELDGKVYPVKCIRNLNGHSIGHYLIHGSKSVPVVACADNTKMEEGEIFAIETFGSTGRGYADEDLECSHYMKNPKAPHVALTMVRTKKLNAHIARTFSTLPFCRRWLERDNGGSATINLKGAKQERYLIALKDLVGKGLVTAVPPLVDVKGSYTAQYEHTFILRPTCKVVLSRGDDY